MANFEDAAIGWDIYRGRNGEVTRAQLNQRLRARGALEISPRTFKHYEKLHRLGYTEYLSINRLDIRHANDTIFDIGDRSRYRDQSDAGPATLVVPRSSSIDTFHGSLTRVSEGFATLRVDDTEQAHRAARASKFNRGVLVFDQVGVERAVAVVEGVKRGSAIELLLEFRSLLETDLVLPATGASLVESRLVVNLGADPSIFQVLQVMHTAFDLFESVRGFVELAGQDQTERLPSLRVRHLEVSNPFDLLTWGAYVVTPVLGYVLTKAPEFVKTTLDAVKSAQDIVHGSHEERRREVDDLRNAERHRVEMQSLQLDRFKAQIEVAQLISELPEGFANFDTLDQNTMARLEALKDQAAEAGGELALNSSSIDFTPDAGSSDAELESDDTSSDGR